MIQMGYAGLPPDTGRTAEGVEEAVGAGAALAAVGATMAVAGWLAGATVGVAAGWLVAASVGAAVPCVVAAAVPLS